MESPTRLTEPGIAAHPLAQLLACPISIAMLLNECAQPLVFQSGQMVFAQRTKCLGLYVVIAGQLSRRTLRKETRVVLASARPGDLVELSAALGNLQHTYTLTAETEGSLILLPAGLLHRAFNEYPPLRMRLLEELAREVSRCYSACKQINTPRPRRSSVSKT